MWSKSWNSCADLFIHLTHVQVAFRLAVVLRVNYVSLYHLRDDSLWKDE